MKQIMKVTNGDLSNGVCDEYGCIYNKNGKRLLKAAKGLKSYSIKKVPRLFATMLFRVFC